MSGFLVFVQKHSLWLLLFALISLFGFGAADNWLAADIIAAPAIILLVAAEDHFRKHRQ